MIRLAMPADIPRLIEIRNSAGENRLTDPGPLTEAEARRVIDKGALWVWQEPEGPIVGFAAIDAQAGSITALLVSAGQEGKGIGRALLKTACDALQVAGHRAATLAAAPGGVAERHYRAADWIEAGQTAKGGIIFRKEL